MEVARIEVDIGHRRAVVLDVPQIPHVAAHAEMVGEEPHNTAARVPAKVVIRGTDGRNRPAVDLRTEQSEPSRDVRSDAAATGAADGHTNDEIAHPINDAVVAKVVRRAEEARAPAEVELRADDALAHGADLCADTSAAVVKAPTQIVPVEAGPRVGGHPRADVA